MNQTGKKSWWQLWIVMILYFSVGGVCGALISRYVKAMNETEVTILTILQGVIVLVIIMYAAYIVQIIIHEAGHLIFGLLTGYKFSSFRIFSFMWVKENGKLKLKHLSLAGTGGQCLMTPPELINGKYPYLLYNLGGSITNMITACIFFVIYIALHNYLFLSYFLLMLSLLGVVSAIINGVPMKLGIINNDGYNALSISKNSLALRSLHMQMKIHEKNSKGIRLKDMPNEWFEVPTDEAMKNSIIAVSGVFVCNRLMDECRFKEAQELIHRFLENDTAIVGLHRNLMICDEIYIEIINGGSEEKIKQLLGKQQKKLMKSMKRYPSVLRTEYAYALLVENDTDKAMKIKSQFEKISHTYPYQNDIESEQELIEWADKLVLSGK